LRFRLRLVRGNRGRVFAGWVFPDGEKKQKQKQKLNTHEFPNRLPMPRHENSL